jgi:hypothetical protein
MRRAIPRAQRAMDAYQDRYSRRATPPPRCGWAVPRRGCHPGCKNRNMEDAVDIGAVNLEASIVRRARAVSEPLVILPLREVGDTGIYPASTLALVKRLRSAGADAFYLHDSEHRRFVVKKSALGEVAAALLVGIGSNAAWDAIKALFRTGPTTDVDVTYLNLDTRDESLTAWRVAGDSEAVLRTIDSLRSQGTSVPAGGETRSSPTSTEETTIDAAGPDHDLRLDYTNDQIKKRRQAADEKLAAAKATISVDSRDRNMAEREARDALQLYARSLDWAEDTPLEDDAHQAMDAAGKWVRTTFGCRLNREGTTYKETCPVSLAHNRIGFSIGGSATRICSLCGEDLSECEHLPGTAYMVPGGPSTLGWCRVCGEEDCQDHAPDQRYRVAVTSMIQDVEVDEISLVSKPAVPEARIFQRSIPTADLQAALGDGFAPGMEVSCDKCLNPCGGLTKHEMSLGHGDRDDHPNRTNS